MPEQLPSGLALVPGQIRFQLRLLLRTSRAITTGMVLPVLLLFLSGSRRGHLPDTRLAAYAVLGMTMTAWTTHGINLVAARDAGVLKRWKASPLPSWCYFLGRIVGTVAVAEIAAAATVLAGMVFFGTKVGPGAAALLLVVFTLGAAACAAAATAVAGFIPGVSSAFPILGLTYLPVVLFSGGFGPPSGEPEWIRAVVLYLPINPIIDATGRALTGTAVSPRDLLVLCGWLIAGIATSVPTFRWQPARPRRWGTRSY